MSGGLRSGRYFASTPARRVPRTRQRAVSITASDGDEIVKSFFVNASELKDLYVGLARSS